MATDPAYYAAGAATARRATVVDHLVLHQERRLSAANSLERVVTWCQRHSVDTLASHLESSGFDMHRHVTLLSLLSNDNNAA